MIKIKCNVCNKEYNLNDDMAGKNGKCKCGSLLKVPEIDNIINTTKNSGNLKSASNIKLSFIHALQVIKIYIILSIFGGIFGVIFGLYLKKLSFLYELFLNYRLKDYLFYFLGIFYASKVIYKKYEIGNLSFISFFSAFIFNLITYVFGILSAIFLGYIYIFLWSGNYLDLKTQLMFAIGLTGFDLSMLFKIITSVGISVFIYYIFAFGTLKYFLSIKEGKKCKFFDVGIKLNKKYTSISILIILLLFFSVPYLKNSNYQIKASNTNELYNVQSIKSIIASKYTSYSRINKVIPLNGGLYVFGDIKGEPISLFGKEINVYNHNINAFLVKLDNNLKEEWTRVININDISFYNPTISVNKDGEGIINIDGKGIIRFNSEGNKIWQKKTSAIIQNNGSVSGIDDSGNTYFMGTSSVNNVFGNNISNGRSIFFTKLDNKGNKLIFKTSDQLINQNVFINSIKVYGNYVYVLGDFSGENFDFFGTKVSSNIKRLKTFFAKMDLNGNVQWIKKGPEYDKNTGGNSYGDFSVDKNESVFITGQFEGSSEDVFGASLDSNKKDLYITKLDNKGNNIFTKITGDNQNEGGTSIITDKDGNIYICGNFIGNDLNLFGKQVKNSGNPLDTHFFTAKLDLNGNTLYLNTEGGGALGINDNGDLFVGGMARTFDNKIFGQEIFGTGVDRGFISILSKSKSTNLNELDQNNSGSTNPVIWNLNQQRKAINSINEISILKKANQITDNELTEKGLNIFLQKIIKKISLYLGKDYEYKIINDYNGVIRIFLKSYGLNKIDNLGNGITSSDNMIKLLNEINNNYKVKDIDKIKSESILNQKTLSGSIDLGIKSMFSNTTEVFIELLK